MSRFAPTWDGADRWLENGKVLDGTKLKTALDDLATAINSTAHSAADGSREADYTLDPGIRVAYPMSESASNKWCFIKDASVAACFATIDLGGSYAVDTALDNDGNISDSQFTVISLTQGNQPWGGYLTTNTQSPAFGSRWLDLEVTLYVDSCTGLIHHPQKSGYDKANAFIIRDSAYKATGDMGHHPFVIASDVDTDVTGGGTITRTVSVRNANQSFAIRVGSNIVFGSGSRLGVRIQAFDE